MTIAARLLAILEAQTAQFDARMAHSSTVIDKMTRSQTLAVRATGQVRSALQNVARDALGLVGPVGNAATGLLTLAGGMTALVTAAAAGGVALLIHKEAEELAKWTEKADAAAAAARRLAAARIGSPVLQRMGIIESFAPDRDKLKEDIRKRVMEHRLTPGFEDMSIPQLAAFDTKLAEMLRTLQGVNAQIGETLRQPEQVLNEMNRQLQLIGLPLDQAAKLQAEWRGLVGASVDEYVRLAVAIDRSTRAIQDAKLAQAAFLEDLRSRAVTGFEFSAGVLGRRRGFTAPGFGVTPTQQLHFLPRDPFAGIGTHFGRGTTPAAPDAGGFRMTPDIAQMLLMSTLMMGRGGGAGGIFAGLGGLTSAAAGLPGIAGKAAAGPLGWAGFGLTALGSVFSMFDKGEERRHKELVHAIEKMGKEIGLERARIFIIDPRTNAITELQQADDYDAVTRVPGYAGTTG